MEDCIFCKIASKEIPAKLVYESENVVGFRDINPQAPTHILVVPKKHFASLNELDDISLMGELLNAVKKNNKKTGHTRIQNSN